VRREGEIPPRRLFARQRIIILRSYRGGIRYQGSALSFESLALDTTPNKEAKPSPAQKHEIYQPLKLEEAMALHIRKVIERTKGRINGRDGAAELLGINPSTLRSRMEKLGVSR
jgi:DNA-binding NtrC family response regulator